MKRIFIAVIGIMIAGPALQGQVIYSSSQQSGCASCSGGTTVDFQSLPTANFPATQDQVFYNNASVNSGYSQLPMESYNGNTVSYSTPETYSQPVVYSQTQVYGQAQAYPQADVYPTSYPAQGVVSTGIQSANYGYADSGMPIVENGFGFQGQTIGDMGAYSPTTFDSGSTGVVYANEAQIYNSTPGMNELPQSTYATDISGATNFPTQGTIGGTFTSSNSLSASPTSYAAGSYPSATYSSEVQNYSTPTVASPAFSSPVYSSTPNSASQSQSVSTGADAQYKAQQAAQMGLQGHVGGGLCAGAKFEGVGWSSGSAQDAIQRCCYWGTRPVAQIGTYRGQDGLWYACVMYY